MEVRKEGIKSWFYYIVFNLIPSLKPYLQLKKGLVIIFKIELELSLFWNFRLQWNYIHLNKKLFLTAIKDECTYAALTQLATAPLTAYYAAQRSLKIISEQFTIHLIGAELQFEADTLDKWETFFLHLVPELIELKIVFIGPELNAENLPLEILSRIR